MQSSINEFEKRGVAILAISSDSPDDAARLARHLGAGFSILCDPQLEAIDAYGVRHPGGGMGEDIARPATFLIDENGIVRWRDLTENWRVRVRPEELLRHIDTVRGAAGPG